jgi:hypothetical protein
MSQRDKNKIIFPGKCIDNNDPLVLGRIRAVPETDNYQEIIAGIPTNCAIYDPTNKEKIIDIKDECKWTIDDPFLFLPLLPFFINSSPKNNEYVHIVFANKDYKYQSQFYIQGPFSSPMASPFEFFEAGKTYLASGTRNKTTLSLKNQTGEYRDSRSYGIFPEPNDNSLLGRGTSDVIVKEDELLLRAGKYIGTLNPNTFPVSNNKRSFLQLSYFRQKKVDLPSYKLVNLIEQVKVVQKLIEWNIFNPETQSDSFTGVINLYNVKADVRTNTTNFRVDSDVQDLLSAPLYQLGFFGETYEQVKLKINQFIIGVNNGKISIPDLVNGGENSYVVPEQIFPYIFRPGPLTYQYIRNFDGVNNSTQYGNVTKFYGDIKLNPADTDTGFGLIFSKGKSGPAYDPKIITQTPSEYINSPVTYATLGGDKLYLLSHESTIPGKGSINLTDTLYGIPQQTFTDDLEGKTNSIVRGEQLIDFLNLLTKFLVAHVHPFPGLPPVPVAVDGTQSAQILSELLNAPNKILNQNIRVN